MTQHGFPIGDYTPFGYLSNYTQFARSWNEVYGGTLRSALDFPGFGWVYPTERRPAAGVAVGAMPIDLDQPLLEIEELDGARLHSPYHSANIFAYAWEHGNAPVEVRYFQTGDDALAGILSFPRGATRATYVAVVLHGYAEEQEVQVSAELVDGRPVITWRRSEAARQAERELPPTRRTYGRPFLNIPDDTHQLGIEAPGYEVCGVAVGRDWDELKRAIRQAAADGGRQAEAGSLQDESGERRDAGACHSVAAVTAAGEVIGAVILRTAEDDPGELVVGLRRHPSFSAGGKSVVKAWSIEESPLYPLPVPEWREIYRQKLDEDTRFWSGAPRLDGDWPAAWKNGFVYDLETTRMCTFPAMGVFRDVWPTWMASYPRVVLAEGSMDMMRLAYADPDLAQRAILTMFRDAYLPNVPCMHAEGQPNMIAADGSICGTSPAWCLPFYNIYLVYLRTLDKAWLEQIYPHLVSFTEWWLTYRTDPEGYVNYKCTWEAGEDCSTRLDPEGTGSADISGIVRPVETQSTMAHCCHVLAQFARELGREDEARRWEERKADFVARTREMFDPEAGRFRDVDLRTGGFLDDSGPADYWDSNPKRYSVLSLTALILGVAAPEQTDAMRREIPHYGQAPWSLWPSWSYVVQEAANEAGLLDFAGENAWRIIDRVYADSDRRSFGPYQRGFPGVAREYWPKLEEFKGSDAYAWGAQTAVFLIRNIAGFQESEATGTWEFHLAPSFAEALRVPGKRYVIRNLHYRGCRFDLSIEMDRGSDLHVELAFSEPVALRVLDQAGDALYEEAARDVHRFRALNAARYTIQRLE